MNRGFRCVSYNAIQIQGKVWMELGWFGWFLAPPSLPFSLSFLLFRNSFHPFFFPASLAQSFKAISRAGTSSLNMSVGLNMRSKSRVCLTIFAPFSLLTPLFLLPLKHHPPSIAPRRTTLESFCTFVTLAAELKFMFLAACFSVNRGFMGAVAAWVWRRGLSIL